MDLSYESGSFIAASALAIVSGLYYVNTYYPETSTTETDKSDTEFKKIRLEAFSDYVSLCDTEIYWDSNEDVSGWKFSDGGYFVLESGTILPSDKVHKLSGKFEWVASDRPIVIWLSDEDFIFRKKM